MEDASKQFGSTRVKYELYKDGAIITPYLDNMGNYKPYRDKANILIAQYENFNLNCDYNSFYIECQKNISTRWNIWEFILYSNGSYESKFIWNNEADLEELNKKVKKWLGSIYDSSFERIFTKCQDLETSWDFETEVIIYFYQEKSPIISFNTPENSHFTFNIFLEQLYSNDENYFVQHRLSAIQDDFKKLSEKMYNLMNYGDLKEKYSQWNVAKFIIGKNKPNWYFDADDNIISFEWYDILPVL